jgi:hypothetical protein
MYNAQIPQSNRQIGGAMPALLSQVAKGCTRPRYAFILLNLLGEVADQNGNAGPFVQSSDGLILLRDWLSDALTPMGRRDPKRQALTAKVEAELKAAGRLPDNSCSASAIVDDEVRQRVRAAAKANLSRAVTELVRAGLLERHYEGYRVDHVNRGAQRHAVYTLVGMARRLIVSSTTHEYGLPKQCELPLR